MTIEVKLFMNTLGEMIFHEKHFELMRSFEDVSLFMHQLSTGEYNSFETYINNANHLKSKLVSASQIMYGENNDFEIYISEKDPALYYNMQSMLLAVTMLKNMLDNLAKTITNSAEV